jgi:hypothetical protein|tara:strand:+ start:1115 stop:1483 length:369 start_codon:yes stop_codon:yes gene_type:complete
MLREDAIYLAGLFDGEGCVQFHRRYRARRGRKGKRYYCLTCTLDISMTDKPTIAHVKKITGVGNLSKRVKNKSPSSKPHWKDQWRWNCSHREAYKIAKCIAPFAVTKQENLLKIVNHYVNEK